MMMHSSTLRSLALGALALALVACRGATNDAGEAPAQYSDDQPGDEPIPNTVRIVSIDRSRLQTDGTVTYRLENLTREDVDNLSARIVFYYPPTQGGDIALPFDTDVMDETSFTLVRGKQDYDIVSTSRAFPARSAAGDKVLATRLDVVQSEPVALTKREGDVAGTLVLNDQLECVDISDEDLRLGMEGAAPTLWIEFRNVWDRPVTGVVVQAVFLDTEGDRATYESDWSRLPNLAVGESGRVEFALTDAAAVRNRPFVVRVRRRVAVR